MNTPNIPLVQHFQPEDNAQILNVPMTDFGPLTRKYWKELVETAHNPLLAEAMRQLVVVHYNERLGGYHDLSHLEELFGHLDRMFNDPARFPEFDPSFDQELVDKARSEMERNKILGAAQAREDARLIAIASTFWHDIVYEVQPDPKMTRVNNEERSARMSKQHLYDLGIQDDMRGDIASWISSTHHHRCNPKTNPAQALFLDADMAIIGSTPERYALYRKQVRKDFAAHSDDAFLQGRYEKFLLPMLKLAERGELFLTPQFQEDYGAQAIANLEAELKDIETVLQARDVNFRRPFVYK